ncbi:hypothetical protein MJ579_06235 [Klebsiella pneumoniae]|nr:hypothetical protein MJ579_06235 [Klebsiella pneumoniae]
MAHAIDYLNLDLQGFIPAAGSSSRELGFGAVASARAISAALVAMAWVCGLRYGRGVGDADILGDVSLWLFAARSAGE